MYHEEEAFYHFTMMDFISLVEQYSDRVWEELEKYSPDVYESFCAYKANQEVLEFISTRKHDEDYYND